MTDSDAILVRCLAAEDALRLPVRASGWGTKLPTNRYLRTRELAAHGLPFRSGAEDAATAVRTSRTLMELHRAGLLVVRRRAKVKYPNVRLTDQGDARARALCGLPGRGMAVAFLAHAAEWGERFTPAPDGLRWVPEIWLNGGRGWGDGRDRQLADVELDYLPAARLGWVACTSSVPGHVAYAVAPAGRAELDSPSPVPRYGRLPVAEADAERLYRRESDAALRALENETPTKPMEIGPLPAVACEMGRLPREVPT